MGCGSSNSVEIVENDNTPQSNINKQTINQSSNIVKTPDINQPNQNINYIPKINDAENNILENKSIIK